MHRRSFIAFVLALGLFLGATKAAKAATFTPGCTAAELVSAVAATQANAEDDTITLAAGCTYALTAVQSTVSGGTGTALLTTAQKVTIHGNGATITRAAGAPAFRFFFVNGAAVAIDHVTLRGGLGVTGFDGGALRVSAGSLDFTDSLADGNATQGLAYGGALGMIGSPGAVSVQRSTFTGNTATNGGAISLDANTATVNVVDSTFTGNVATTNGGAINATTESGTGSTMAIAFCTITGNRANSFGGGVHQDSQTVTISNSIVAKNTKNGVAADAAADVDGGLVNGGFNVVGIGTTAFANTGTTQSGTTAAPLDPLLAALAGNGGAQQTIALLDGSPAIDAGSVALAASLANDVDERGFTRTSTTPDAGAFERLAALAIAPTSVKLGPGGTFTFTATGGTGLYGYSVSPAPSGGTITSTGAYTAGATTGDDTIVLSDGLSTMNATAHVAPLQIAPASISLTVKGTASFAATGGTGTYTFSLSAMPSGGAITAAGAYTAGPNPGDDTVVVSDGTSTSSSVAHVSFAAPLSISPPSADVAANGSLVFQGFGGSGTYTFTLSAAASGGSILTNGTYTAGGKAGDDAISLTDGFTTVSAVAHVTPPAAAPPVELMPGTASTPPGGLLAFTTQGGVAPFVFDLAADASGGVVDANGNYRAGHRGKVTDVVRVTDAAGAIATATVTVGASLTVTPATATVAPLGVLAFSAAGGLGPYHWSLATNASGGAISAAGAYTAGATKAVTDLVVVADGLGNSAQASVVVGGGIVLDPPSASVAPLGKIAITATGGSGSGFRFALAANASGGSVDGAGNYVAGATGNVSDVVVVRDDNGNAASVAIAVGPALGVTPATSTVAPGATITFTLSGGSGSGYAVTIATNVSGGSIGEHGVYTAGPNAGTDVITVTDGNGAKVTVTVNVAASAVADAGTSIAPANDAGASGDHGTTAATPATTPDASESGGCTTSPQGTNGSNAFALLFGLALLVWSVRRSRARD